MSAGDVLGVVGGAFTSIISGGLTGIFGVAVQRYADFKNKELDLKKDAQQQAHEIDMRKVDAEISAQEWASRTKVAEVEAAGMEAKADSEAFGESFKMEPVRYSDGVKPSVGQAWLFSILDFVRGCVRPLLTIYLCVVTTVIYWHAKALLSGTTVSAGEALDLVKLIVGTVLYLTTTCVLWWFGTRNKAQPPKITSGPK